MGAGMFRWLKRFFAAHIVQDIPADMIACEFGCRKGECRYEAWQNCERRIGIQQSVERAGLDMPVRPEQWRRRVPNVPNKNK